MQASDSRTFHRSQRLSFLMERADGPLPVRGPCRERLLRALAGCFHCQDRPENHAFTRTVLRPLPERHVSDEGPRKPCRLSPRTFPACASRCAGTHEPRVSAGAGRTRPGQTLLLKRPCSGADGSISRFSQAVVPAALPGSSTAMALPHSRMAARRLSRPSAEKSQRSFPRLEGTPRSDLMHRPEEGYRDRRFRPAFPRGSPAATHPGPGDAPGRPASCPERSAGIRPSGSTCPHRTSVFFEGFPDLSGADDGHRPLFTASRVFVRQPVMYTPPAGAGAASVRMRAGGGRVRRPGPRRAWPGSPA